ncbi:hypothetical protein HDU85_002697 [Gaertneriomyces sp. JEL0708]|nr:hypothetical protein HDU85_002697 [Gaertneriomyces sp. JEL0708]
MEFGTSDRKEPATKVLNKLVAKCVGLSRKISSNIRRHVGKRLKRQPMPARPVIRTRILSDESTGEWDALSVPETQRKMMAKRTLAYMDPETGTWVSRGSGSGSSAHAGSRSSRMAHDETAGTITSLENNESYQIPLKENTFDALFPERPSHDGVAAIVAPRVSISTTHKSALFLTRTASRRTAVTFNSGRSSLSSRRPRRSTTRSRTSSRSISRSRSRASRRTLLREHLVDRLAELARIIHESASLDVEQVAAQLNQLQCALGVLQTNKAHSTATSLLLEEPVHNEAIEAPDIPEVGFGDSDWEDVDRSSRAEYASVLPRSRQQLTGLRSIRLANNITITNQLVSPPPPPDSPAPAPLPQHPHPATASPSPSPSPPPHSPHAPPSEMDDPGLRKYQSSSSISSTSTVTVKTLRRQTKTRDISPVHYNATRKIKNCAVRKRPDSLMRSRGQHSSSVSVRKRRTSDRGSGAERSQAEQLDLILALLQRIRMES